MLIKDQHLVETLRGITAIRCSIITQLLFSIKKLILIKLTGNQVALKPDDFGQQ